MQAVAHYIPMTKSCLQIKPNGLFKVQVQCSKMCLHSLPPPPPLPKVWPAGWVLEEQRTYFHNLRGHEKISLAFQATCKFEKESMMQECVSSWRQHP